MQEWLGRYNTEMMKHAPYSPDLVPCDFWLFLSLKRNMRCLNFETDAQAIQETQIIFGWIPK